MEIGRKCDDGRTVQKLSFSSKFCTQFVQIYMVIVTLTDALLQRPNLQPGRILRNRILCRFSIKRGKRTHSFLVATSVGRKQSRINLGRWTLLSCLTTFNCQSNNLMVAESKQLNTVLRAFAYRDRAIANFKSLDHFANVY